jgi:hypothetical protein
MRRRLSKNAAQNPRDDDDGRSQPRPKAPEYDEQAGYWDDLAVRSHKRKRTEKQPLEVFNSRSRIPLAYFPTNFSPNIHPYLNTSGTYRNLWCVGAVGEVDNVQNRRGENPIYAPRLHVRFLVQSRRRFKNHQVSCIYSLGNDYKRPKLTDALRHGLGVVGVEWAKTEDYFKEPEYVCKTLFVNYLNRHIDGVGLQRFFEERRFQVVWAKVLRDHSTKESEGYGLVEVDSEEAARRALALSGQYLDGGQIGVKLSLPYRDVFQNVFRDKFVEGVVGLNRHGKWMVVKRLKRWGR